MTISFQSLVERSVDHPVHNRFFLTNPSVAVFNGKIFAVENCIDHYQSEKAGFIPYPSGPKRPGIPVISLVYLAEFDADLNVIGHRELTYQRPQTPWPWRGFECPRLFVWRGDMWITGCSPGNRFEPTRFYIARVDYDACKLVDIYHLGPEKNWMPDVIGDNLRFHFRLGVIAHIDADSVPITVPMFEPVTPTNNNPFAKFHGGSQVLPYDDDVTGDRLCIVHAYAPRPVTRQHLVRVSSTGRPIKATEAITFRGAQLEVACGMAYHPDGKRLMISYGRTHADGDTFPFHFQERPYIATVDLSEVRALI